MSGKRVLQDTRVKGTLDVDGDTNTKGDVNSTNKAHRARYIIAGPMGPLSIVDIRGTPDPVEIFRIMADAQPATAVVFTVLGGDSITLNLSDLSVAVAGALSAAGMTSSADIVSSGSSVGRFFGQRTGGLGNCATFGGKGPSGTIMGSLSITAAGMTQVDNPSALSIPFSISSGYGRAPGFGQAAETNIGTVGSTATVNWQSSMCNRLTLTSATPCTISFTAPPLVCAGLTLKVAAPASGTTPAITWPATVHWAGGTKPVPAGLGRTTVFFFYYDGSAYWGQAIVDAV